jgi:hypothetical protein
LKETAEIEEPADRESLFEMHLDQDRQGVPGSPDLARLILDKILASTVVVADVTPVGETWTEFEVERKKLVKEKKKKKLINPNVAIEVGYALGTLTDRAFLMVMNENYGSRDDLPFDLRAKAGPITFNLKPGASRQEIASAAKALAAKFKEALNLVFRNRSRPAANDEALPAIEPKDGLARFRSVGTPLGGSWNSLELPGSSEHDIYMKEGPALWLRLRPKAALRQPLSFLDLKAAALGKGSITFRPFSWVNLAFLRAEDGFGSYSLHSHTQTDDVTDSVVFAFETGEVWAISTALMGRIEKKRIVFTDIASVLIRAIYYYTEFLQNLGLETPFIWTAGLEGIHKYRLSVLPQSGFTSLSEGEMCLSDVIKSEGIFDGTQSPGKALLPLFHEICRKCATPFPEHLRESIYSFTPDQRFG